MTFSLSDLIFPPTTTFFFFFGLKQSPLPSLDLEAIDTFFFFFPFEGLAALYLDSEYTNGHYERTASPFGEQMLWGGVTPRVQILVPALSVQGLLHSFTLLGVSLAICKCRMAIPALL